MSAEDARGLLDKNEGNRKVRSERVSHYARLIRDGFWKLTGDAVCVAPDGRLLNGQHRLMAIVEEGRTVPLLVLMNCPEDSFEAMDAGMVRSVAVLFNKNGAYAPPVTAAISRMVWLWIEEGQQPGWNTGAKGTDRIPTGHELWATFSQYRDEITASAGVAKILAPLFSAAGAGMAYFVTAIEHGDAAMGFWRLVDPKYEGGLVRGHPARTLRDFMLLEPRSRKMRPTEFVARSVAAFNAWAKGETLAQSHYSLERGCPEVAKTIAAVSAPKEGTCP